MLPKPSLEIMTIPQRLLHITLELLIGFHKLLKLNPLHWGDIKPGPSLVLIVATLTLSTELEKG